MKTSTVQATGTAEISANDFADLVSITVLAETDLARPILNAVRVRITKNEVAFTATDSYLLGTITRPANGTHFAATPGEFLVPAQWLVGVAKSIKAARYVGPVTLSCENDKVTARYFGKFGLVDDTADLVTGTYPDVDKLVDGWTPAGITAPLGLNPIFLARLVKIAPWNTKGTPCAKLEVNKIDGPVRWTGAGVVVYQMPVRL